MMTSKTRAAIISAALCAALLPAGCAVGPDYKAPPESAIQSAAFKEAPEGWKTVSPADAAIKGDWWTVYGDPPLDRIEREVLTSNQEIAQYAERLAQAMALLTETNAELYPSVSAGLDPGRERSSTGTVRNTVQLQGSVSWEIDLWGKLRRASAAQAALVQGSEADLANARLSAQASAATIYFTIRSLDKRIGVYDGIVKVYEKYVETMSAKASNGQVILSDLTQAEEQLHSARASREALVLERAQNEHALAVLLGKAPSELSLPRASDPLPKVPEIPAALPTSLLERRPDVASAERSVAAANEEIGIAMAGYFPDLTLSGSGGWSGRAVANLVRADNLIWSIGASSAVTLFDAGSTSAKVREAEAAYRESVASYRQTVLTALQEVEDALSTQSSLERRITHTAAAFKSSADTARITVNRYNAGMIDYTDAASSEATRLSNEQSLLSLELDALTNSVSLVKALGGGWLGLR